MSFASYIAHFLPLARRLNILLFDNLQYVRTLVFMYNVYFEHACPVVQKMFVRSSFIHKFETRSHMYNFHLSYISSKFLNLLKVFIELYYGIIY